MALARGILVWLPEKTIRRLSSPEKSAVFDEGFILLRAQILLNLDAEEVRRTILEKASPLCELSRYCLLGGDVSGQPGPEILAPALVSIRAFYLGDRTAIVGHLPLILRSYPLARVLLETCSPEVVAELNLDPNVVLRHGIEYKILCRHSLWLKRECRIAVGETNNSYAYSTGRLGLLTSRELDDLHRDSPAEISFRIGYRHRQIELYQAGRPFDRTATERKPWEIEEFGSVPGIETMNQVECWTGLSDAILGVWPEATWKIARQIEDPTANIISDPFLDTPLNTREGEMSERARALPATLRQMQKLGFRFAETIWTSLCIINGQPVEPEVFQDDRFFLLATEVGHPGLKPRSLMLSATSVGPIMHDEVNFYRCKSQASTDEDLPINLEDELILLRNYVEGTFLKFRGLSLWGEMCAALRQEFSGGPAPVVDGN